MAKNEAPVELDPEAFIAETEALPKPAKRRAARAGKAALAPAASFAPEPAPWKTSTPAESRVKPIALGIGIAAAVAVAALALNSNKGARKGIRAPQSTITKMLTKAALLAVGRFVAKRAARALAQRAVGAVAARAATSVADRYIGQRPAETR